MKKFTSHISSFKWINFISSRISKVDRKGRTAVTSTLASLGVCFGVMALIVVMSVMNGFQMSFIDAIMEISSYHIQVSELNEDEGKFLDYCAEDKNIRCAVPFYEAQGLMVTSTGRQSSAFIRAVPSDVMKTDERFISELKIVSGSFSLDDDDSIVIGNTLARNLGARVGSRVNIVAMSGSSDSSLLSNSRSFVVKGIFYCGYADLNAAYSFVNMNAGEKYFGSQCEKIFGVKIKKSSSDNAVITSLKKVFPSAKFESWREYNRSFFGALRIEKNMLFLLVFLIFIVVAINIFNSMKRLVYERKEDIAVLSSLGATSRQIQMVFVFQGSSTGLKGSVPGLVLGVLISKNIKFVFEALSKIQYFFSWIFCRIFSPESLGMISENPMFAVYASIPARMVLSEVLFIFMFGVASSLGASFFASRSVLKMTVSEVLRDE